MLYVTVCDLNHNLATLAMLYFKKLLANIYFNNVKSVRHKFLLEKFMPFIFKYIINKDCSNDFNKYKFDTHISDC